MELNKKLIVSIREDHIWPLQVETRQLRFGTLLMRHAWPPLKTISIQSFRYSFTTQETLFLPAAWITPASLLI